MTGREDRAWREYGDRFRREVLPKMLGSGVFLSIGSEPDDFDVQQATETGAALLLDKPIVLLVPVGRRISERLRRAADLVLDDFDVSDPACQERLAEALRTVGL